MLIVILAFSNVLSFLDQDSEHPIIRKVTNSQAFNAFLQMWILMLGEFNIEGMSNGPFGGYLTWTFFVIGSFLLIIVCMNMLIGIMTDTF
jgi:hypothetical protein